MSTPNYREKYIRFRSDLHAAVRAGVEAERNEPDSGTCNLDSVSVYLRNWKEAEIREAARMAGIGTEPAVHNGVKTWLFFPKTGGMAAKRTANAEAMQNELRRRGYLATVHYQID